MAKWTGWLAALGGLIAVIGQFWGADFYLPVIGGAVAIIFGLWAAMSK